MTIAEGASVIISNGLSFDGSIINSGSMRFTSGSVLESQQNQDIFANQAGASIDLEGEVDFIVDRGSPILTNFGTFRKTAGMGNANITFGFANFGLVQAQTGTINFRYGGQINGT